MRSTIIGREQFGHNGGRGIFPADRTHVSHRGNTAVPGKFRRHSAIDSRLARTIAAAVRLYANPSYSDCTAARRLLLGERRQCPLLAQSRQIDRSRFCPLSERSGHRWSFARFGYDANDPSRTLRRAFRACRLSYPKPVQQFGVRFFRRMPKDAARPSFLMWISPAPKRRSDEAA